MGDGTYWKSWYALWSKAMRKEKSVIFFGGVKFLYKTWSVLAFFWSKSKWDNLLQPFSSIKELLLDFREKHKFLTFLGSYLMKGEKSN